MILDLTEELAEMGKAGAVLKVGEFELPLTFQIEDRHLVVYCMTLTDLPTEFNVEFFGLGAIADARTSTFEKEIARQKEEEAKFQIHRRAEIRWNALHPEEKTDGPDK